MTLSTDEIVATVLEKTKSMEVENSSDESSDDEQASKSVSSAVACEAFSIALTWLEAQNVDPAHLMLVQKWRVFAPGLSLPKYLIAGSCCTRRTIHFQNEFSETLIN